MKFRHAAAMVAALSITLVAASALAVPPLRVPFPCDETYRISQGHNTGSHTAKGAYAWDIAISVGGEVAAPADGVVRKIKMDSTVGGCDDAYANDANYVIVDFQDGTEALFLHLQANSSRFQEGDQVLQGDVVGKVGLTGWVCGAHLHFQIQETCNSWWCQSIPASFDMFGDPSLNDNITSNNCPELEPCSAVLTDAGETIISEEDRSCFERETNYWWSAPSGHSDHHYYTYGTDAAEDETTGTWTFDVATAGAFRLEAYIPETEADSQNAVYVVGTGAGTVESSPVDQSATSGWVDLGIYHFQAGEDRSVTLGDATGEAYDLRRKLAYDAVRLTWEPQDDMTPDMGGDDGDVDMGVGSQSDTGTSDDDPSNDAGSSVDEDSDDEPRANRDDQTITASSGCSTGGTPGRIGSGLILLAFGAFLRRRKSAQRNL